MKTEILTLKIRLKLIEKSDSKKLHALRTNPEVAKYINRNLEVNISDMEIFIEERLSNVENMFFYKIETMDNSELVGTIVLKNIDRKLNYAEIGYELLPNYEGQGIMSMAMEKIIELAFGNLGLKELEAFTHKDNLKSQKLLNRFGFKKTEKVDEKYPTNLIYNLKKL